MDHDIRTQSLGAVYISAYPCNPSEPSAGSRLAVQWVKELAREYSSVVVIYFSRNEDQAKVTFGDNVEIIAVKISLLDTLVSQLIHPNLPIGASCRAFLGRKCFEIIQGRVGGSTKIFVDFTQAFFAVPEKYRTAITLRIHDVVSELYLRQSRGGPVLRRVTGCLEWLRWSRIERNIWSDASLVVCLTQREANSVLKCAPTASVKILPPKPTYICDSRSINTVVQGRIIFWGNMGRPENNLAVKHFISEIWPRIKRQRPFASFRVIGANPDPALVHSNFPSVSFSGYVEDPCSEFEMAHIAVVPLQFGAGVKIKVLETIASGIPTVCTPIGAEGVEADSRGLFIAMTAEQFVSTCVQLLDTIDA